MLKIFLVAAIFVAAAQASAKCSLKKELECMSGFSKLDTVKDNKAEICMVYQDIEKCLSPSHCDIHMYADMFKATQESCEDKCDLAQVVTCKIKTYQDLKMNHGSFCKEYTKFEKCFDNTDCDNLKEAEYNFMKNYCGSCAAKEFSCLRTLKNIKKVEHSKEKICSLFETTKACLDETKCHFNKHQNLIKAVETSCEGTCDLSAVVKCKDNLYEKLNITTKNICQEYPKFDVCFENTNCDDLYSADQHLMKHFCH